MKSEETGGRGGETSRGKGRKKGQKQEDKDVRGQRGDKWRRARLLNPCGSPSGRWRENFQPLKENSATKEDDGCEEEFLSSDSDWQRRRGVDVRFIDAERAEQWGYSSQKRGQTKKDKQIIMSYHVFQSLTSRVLVSGCSLMQSGKKPRGWQNQLVCLLSLSQRQRAKIADKPEIDPRAADWAVIGLCVPLYSAPRGKTFKSVMLC